MPSDYRRLSTDCLEDGAGKKYPRLCVFLSAVFMFFLLFYLPFFSQKSRGQTAFVWPSNQTRNVHALIRPDDPTTLIQPSIICRPPEASQVAPYLLVVVCSAVNNRPAREAIRNSWALDQGNNIKVIFLIGRLKNSTTQFLVEEESRRYGDLVQEDFIDSYANLTVKSLMLLKWVNKGCDKLATNGSEGTQYILKTDDDMYVNLKKLYEVVRSNKRPNLLMGSLICNAIPIKDPYNKWYVPSYMFSEKKYPNYLSGTGYLMHRTTAKRLYEAGLQTPVFHLEDIFVTGILSRKVGIQPVDNVGFSYNKRKLNACLYRQTITTHHMKHSEMIGMYQKLQETKNVRCGVIKSKFLRTYSPGRCKWK